MTGRAGSEGADCPLCGARSIDVESANARTFFHCPSCRLAFVDPRQRPTSGEEFAHYLSHENDPADERYRAFLDRLASPVTDRLSPGAEGLDYGSGPGPTLSRMLSERGFRTVDFDPFFAPDESLLRRSYDFVVSTETVEHFFDPAAEFRRISRMLRPGGLFGMMTEVLTDEVRLNEWRYARDPTHVALYRMETLEWIAAHFEWDLELPARNVAIFTDRND